MLPDPLVNPDPTLSVDEPEPPVGQPDVVALVFGLADVEEGRVVLLHQRKSPFGILVDRPDIRRAPVYQGPFPPRQVSSWPICRG